MTPDEIDYQEAVRRILEAEETGATSLDLSEITSLRRLPPELERLTTLLSLDLSGYWHLSGDLSTNLTALREIALQS